MLEGLRTAALVLVWIVAIGAVPTTVSAQTAGEVGAAIALHDAARDGSRSDIEAALDALNALADAYPGNATVLAYLGSAHAIFARNATNPSRKLANVNKGLRFLDEAAELAPEDFAVRLVRANVQMNLPSMFARGDDAISDMIALDRIFRSDPAPARAEAMIPVYEELKRSAGDAGDWTAGLALAREQAAKG